MAAWQAGLTMRHRLAIVVVAMLLRGAAVSQDAIAVGSQQQSFALPGEVVQALISAAKAGDEETLVVILSSEAGELISSGDSVSDEEGWARFVRAYEQSNKLERPTETKPDPDGPGAGRAGRRLRYVP